MHKLTPTPFAVAALRTLVPLAPLVPLLCGCVADASEDSRSERVGRVSLDDSVAGFPYTLNWHGGTGGNTSTPLGCGANGVAVGVYGATTQRNYMDPYNFIQRFGLICATFDRTTGNLQPAWTGPAGGPLGSFGYHTQCPAGQIMVGIGGYSGTYVDYVGPICQPLADLGSRDGEGRWWDEGAGGYGGYLFQDPCPHGYAVTSGLVHSGGFVDGLEVTCEVIAP